MKIGANKSAKVSSKPQRNNSTKNLLIGIIIAITAVMIVWVYTMGRKAEQTIQVIRYARDIYKNEVITEDMLRPYDMLVGEFEKYAYVDDNGVKHRSVWTWEEMPDMIGSFAAYPLKQDTIATNRDVIASRIDNSDTVLYTFPGKNILALEVATDDLGSYKGLLEPGDRINITAIYTAEEDIEVVDAFGEVSEQTEELYKAETMFTDIILADLLNSNGDSILDLMQMYNELDSVTQAMYDQDEGWKEETTPESVLVALTPEEEALYYRYLNRDGVQFKMSLPQRVE